MRLLWCCRSWTRFGSHYYWTGAWGSCRLRLRFQGRSRIDGLCLAADGNYERVAADYWVFGCRDDQGATLQREGDCIGFLCIVRECLQEGIFCLCGVGSGCGVTACYDTYFVCKYLYCVKSDCCEIGGDLCSGLTWYRCGKDDLCDCRVTTGNECRYNFRSIDQEGDFVVFVDSFYVDGVTDKTPLFAWVSSAYMISSGY